MVLVTLSIICLTAGAQAATLHGTIYEWSDFEKPMRNVILEVNSTPAQYMVATAGTYSFNLSPGSYLIKGKYYRNNILEYVAEEDIRIDREGDFVHDLLLFPPTESEYEYLGDINLTGDINLKDEYNNYIYFILTLIGLIFALSLIIFYWFKRRRNSPAGTNTSEPAAPAQIITETRLVELPSDLHNLYDMILQSGGRTTQKELRKRLPFSEAKVSLMLDDLENRGLIQKIKKGHSNIIIANQKIDKLAPQVYTGRKL